MGRNQIDYPDKWIEICSQYKTRNLTGSNAMDTLLLKSSPEVL